MELKEWLDNKTSITYIARQDIATILPSQPVFEAPPLFQADDGTLESLLNGLEAEIARKAHLAERNALWRAARNYRRSRVWLEDVLPPETLTPALTDPMSPSVTWQVLRHLCRHIRFNARSRLGSALRLKRCRTMAAGEVYLLIQQRAARHDRQGAGDVLEELCQAVG